MAGDRKTRILTLFPDEATVTRVAPFLSRATMEVTHVATGAEALAGATATPFDLVTLSVPLPDMSAETFIGKLQSLRGAERPLPVVLMTSNPALAVAEMPRPAQARVVDLDAQDEVIRNAIAEALGVAARLSIRIPVRLELEIAAGRTLRFGETRNISRSGLLISSGRPLAPGADFRFQLTLPYTYTPLSGHAEVVRKTDKRYEQTLGFGARYVELPEGDGDRLETFIRQELAAREATLAGPHKPT